MPISSAWFRAAFASPPGRAARARTSQSARRMAIALLEGESHHREDARDRHAARVAAVEVFEAPADLRIHVFGEVVIEGPGPTRARAVAFRERMALPIARLLGTREADVASEPEAVGHGNDAADAS